MENTAHFATTNENAPSHFRNQPHINSREGRFQASQPHFGGDDHPAGPANDAPEQLNQRPSQYNSTDHSAAMDGEEIDNTPFAPDDLHNPDQGETISFTVQNYSHQRGNGSANSQITF